MLSYFDFPLTAVAVDANALYDDGRDRALASPGGMLVGERVFYSGKRPGREIVFEDPYFTSSLRLLLVDQRLYMALVVMSFRYSVSSPAVRASILRTANKFFDSFDVNEFPDLKSEVRPMSFAQ